eukprot:SM000182S03955  [mRNA]  locus=s182:233419:234339:- [translate_table: standard]
MAPAVLSVAVAAVEGLDEPIDGESYTRAVRVKCGAQEFSTRAVPVRQVECRRLGQVLITTAVLPKPPSPVTAIACHVVCDRRHPACMVQVVMIRAPAALIQTWQAVGHAPRDSLFLPCFLTLMLPLAKAVNGKNVEWIGLSKPYGGTMGHLKVSFDWDGPQVMVEWSSSSIPPCLSATPLNQIAC